MNEAKVDEGAGSSLSDGATLAQQRDAEAVSRYGRATTSLLRCADLALGGGRQTRLVLAAYCGGLACRRPPTDEDRRAAVRAAKRVMPEWSRWF